MLTKDYDRVVLVQVLLLASFCLVYFQSPIILDLEPQQSDVDAAPAKRLIVFALDGLRAKTFLEYGCRHVKDLSKIFLQQGQVGISRTRARQRYMPLFSGLYQTHAYALIASNPIPNIDTIFNRSLVSYAWGSDEFLRLPIQHKVHAPQKRNSLDRNKWILADIDQFLSKNLVELQQRKAMIMVVQLESLLETNGMSMYRKNLNVVQREIWKFYKTFEQMFKDQQTAYLLTANHGITDQGHFGGSSREEIEVPFMIWGAGISNGHDISGRSFSAHNESSQRPLHILHQIQLTSLMSALLGVPSPVQNRGRLPGEFLNTSERYAANVAFANALQMKSVARKLLERHNSGILSAYMPHHWINLQQLNKFGYMGKLLWHQKRFRTLKEHSSNMQSLLLQCIKYYENYYRQTLIWALALSYLAWQHFLRCQESAFKRRSSIGLRVAKFLICLFIILMILFVMLQRTPLCVSCILLTPGVMWWIALRAHATSERISSYTFSWIFLFFIYSFSIRAPRYMLALGYMGFVLLHNRATLRNRSINSVLWCTLVCCLGLLAWMAPSLGYDHRGLLIVSIIFTFLHPLRRPSHYVAYKRKMLHNGIVLLVAIIHIMWSPIPWLLHIIARLYLSYVLYPSTERQPLGVLLYDLNTLYALLCTSHEALVIQLLLIELQLSLRLQHEYGEEIVRKDTTAMYMLVYSLFSFCVIGNDADFAKYLMDLPLAGYGYFSALSNGFLIGLKLLLPILMVMCIFCRSSDMIWIKRKEVFRETLALGNLMAVLCLVRMKTHENFWETGVKLLQFLAVQILPPVLLLLLKLSHSQVRINRKQRPEVPI